MIGNYLKIALRNLVKHKLFSFINIFGLAMSMAVGLVVIMLVKETYSYDKFHPQMDRFYRITTAIEQDNAVKTKYASSPLQLADQLQMNYDISENVTRIRRGIISDMSAGERTFEIE